MGFAAFRVRAWQILGLILVSWLTAACATREAPASASAPADPPATTVAGGNGATPAVPLPRAPALVTTVTLAMNVQSVGEATSRARSEAARVEGYVATMNASGEGNEQRASLTLRIPARDLKTFRDALSKLGETKSEEERVEDVGEERADRHARLANARAEEKRILELLAQRTGSLSEVLAAERELSRVRETIERLDAQASALEGRIALATVHVTFTSNANATAGAFERVARGARDGVRYAGVVVVGLTVAAAQAGPTLLVMAATFALIGFAVRAILRRSRRIAAIDRA